MKKRWAGNREIRNRFAYRLIYGGGKWTDEGRVLTFRITRWRKKGRMRWMQWKLDVNHGNTLTPVLFHYIFISFLFLFPFFFLFFCQVIMAFRHSSEIPEFRNSYRKCVEGTTIPTTWLLLFYGVFSSPSASLRRECDSVSKANVNRKWRICDENGTKSNR